MGVSMTRCAPNFSSIPSLHLVGALVVADLLAHEEDAIVALHLLDHAPRAGPRGIAAYGIVAHQYAKGPL